MTLAVAWSELTIAAAFILGAVSGTVATIRLMRFLLDYLRDERKNDDTR